MIINMLQMLKERWESLSYSLFLCLSLLPLAHWSAKGNHYANEPAAAVFISYNHPRLRGDLQGRAVVHTHNRSELYKYFPFFSPHFFSKEEQRRLCVFIRGPVSARERVGSVEMNRMPPSNSLLAFSVSSGCDFL